MESIQDDGHHAWPGGKFVQAAESPDDANRAFCYNMTKWDGKPPDEVAIFAVEVSKLDCTPKRLKCGGYHIPTTRIAPECLRLHLLVMPIEAEEAEPPHEAEEDETPQISSMQKTRAGIGADHRRANPERPTSHTKPPRPKRGWCPASVRAKNPPAVRPPKMKQRRPGTPAVRPPKMKQDTYTVQS